MKRFLLALIFGVYLGQVLAAVEVHEFDSPEQEQRYQDLIKELRCTVCQNQNIADSGAELAADLRRKTYQLVRAGKNAQEVRGYMVQRYGNFVLYRPPAKGGLLLIWAAPLAILLIGALLLWRVLVRRSRAAAEDTPDSANLAEAERLLKDTDKDS